ncbi:MAG: hypothetical protein PHX62_03750 [Bacilli bacterium]|nr:hypothetical protein [Bacilli bacterium]
MRILSNAIGNKKKYDILKTANEITTLKSKLKSNEALMIANPDIINDEKFKTNIETTKLNINKLGRELKAIKNTDYLIDKKDKCLNQLDALLSKRMIYALLAKAINLKVIVLPNYKIILVLNKSNLDEASFRKQIHQFVEKAESSLFIDSIKIRQNGMPVNYSFTMTKI